MTYNSDELLAFWFGPAPRRVADVTARMTTWFGNDKDFDQECIGRFADLARAAAAGELDEWAFEPRQRLALILALDQLPRNIHRGDVLAFAQDNRALALALDGLSTGMDRKLTPLQRLFFYMPLQHSEDLEIQQTSLTVYEQLMLDAGKLEKTALKNAFDFAKRHHDLVARFGRFPHRNVLLGREATAAEVEYLAGGGATFGQ